MPAQAQSAAAEHRKFDARIEFNRAFVAPPGASQAAAVNSRSAVAPGLKVQYDEVTGVTRNMSNPGGYLTNARGGAARDIALEYARSNNNLLGLEAVDMDEYEVTDEVESRVSGSTHIYLRQKHLGLPVYQGQLQVNVNKKGRVYSVNNAFMPAVARAANNVRPTVTPEEAVSAIADDLGVILSAAPSVASEADSDIIEINQAELSSEGIYARLMWLPIRRGQLRLVWNVQVQTLGGAHFYDITVDAHNSKIWTRFDWVSDASYRVYPFPVESPSHTSPLPPADARVLEVNPHNTVASPFGWHDTDGVAGHEYTTLRGNNVYAYADRYGDNTPDVSEPNCGSGLVCDNDYPISFSTQQPSTYRYAATTNLFYWNNIIHDIQYQYGFDEAAGNFQDNNYGKGGIGGDKVLAEVQDSSLHPTDPKFNNANFATPPDGGDPSYPNWKPRMQFYIFDYANPDRDGAFDSGWIVHEYGHGISNRLVGGPSNTSCLGNWQQPGEGLSDWWAMVYTAKASDQATDGRGWGTYLKGEPTTGAGFRRQRYSTDQAINNYTYESLSTVRFYSGKPGPHDVGEIWTQAAWEVYWALVDKWGFGDLYNATGGAGNQRAMLYVNEGLKNTACSPTFTDVRDGILQATQELYDGQDYCRVWKSFAAFGLGTDAISGGSNSINSTNGFAVPAACAGIEPVLLPWALDTVSDSNDTGLVWSEDGGWLGEESASESHDGVDYARSKDISDSQSTSMETTVTGPGTVSFWWKVSSEQGYDYLRFYLDNFQQPGAVQISGEVDWQLKTVPVPAGTHTLRWTYYKDGSESDGADQGLVDQVTFNPALAEALDTTNLTWNEDGSWLGHLSSTANDGVDAASSKDITHNESTTLETTVTGNGGTLSFWWKVSSEACCDKLRFKIDGVEQSGAAAISGTVDWQQVTLPVPAGTHTLSWTYTKDHSVSSGSDEGWVDQVSYIPFIVLNANDSGPGSLRDIIATATGGTVITLDAALDGGTITLAGTQLLIDKDITIDASSLPNGLTISGNNTSRVFEIATGNTVEIRGVTVTGGNSIGDLAGGILNRGALTLIDSTLDGNHADGSGGAIYNNGGSLSLVSSTVSNNSSDVYGGALFTQGAGAEATLMNTTVAVNTAESGAAIFMQDGELTLNQSTLAGNTATSGAGAIYARVNTTVNLENSIVAANIDIAAISNDIWMEGGSGNVVPTGNNLIGDNTTVSSEFPVGPLAGNSGSPLDPELADLGNYGGPTQTMPPLSASPAIDAGSTGTLTTDQRGYPRPSGLAYDLGAVESLPIAEAADATGLSWTTGGDREWMGLLSATSHDGLDVATSGDIGNSQQSYAEATVTGNGGTLTFWWKVSSEANWDYLRFTMNGVELPAVPGLSGEVDWHQITVPIPAGTHTLRWTYSKDTVDIDPVGSDTGWLDEVAFTPFIVSNANDSGPGSLRDTIASAASGSVITLDAALDGGTITLAGTQLLIDKDLAIDASGLPNGLTVSGNNASRVLEIATGNTVELRGFTIADGSSGNGAGIENQGGTLNLVDMTISNNHALSYGGGINNGAASTVTLTNTTLSGNTTGQSGGAIHNSSADAVMILINSTISGNSANYGGGLFSYLGDVTIVHTTISDNNALLGGGGIVANSGSVHVENSIIAGNTDNGTAPDFWGGAVVNVAGENLIGINATVSALFPVGPLNGSAASPLDPELAILGNYGGPTQTMPPLESSPVLDAAGIGSLTTDQRGYPRPIGLGYDLGGVESLSVPEAVDATDLSWSLGGDGQWMGQLSAAAHDGVDAATSGDLSDNQLNYMEATVTGNGGTLTFWWKVSSQSCCDFLGFAMDGAGHPGVPAISGEVDWTQVSVPVPAGTHTFRWTYSKNESVSDGLDAGWVDEVSFTAFTVSNTNDSGVGSLRDTIAGAASGGVITLDAALDGGTITLAGTQLLIDKDLTIDASSLPNGLTISGDNSSRVFEIVSGNTVELRGITVTGGNSAGSGGGIMNRGSLTLIDSTLSANHTDGSGGGIMNEAGGGLWLVNSTLSANDADVYGGALFSQGAGAEATLINSTVFGNTAVAAGGIFLQTGTVTLNHATIASNIDTFGSGGIYARATTVLNVENSIVAANTAGDIFVESIGSVLASGANLIGDNSGVSSVFPLGPLAGNASNPLDPMLDLLGNYGGPTQTMPPLSGSPAIDAGVSGSLTTDQRGYPRPTGPGYDLGAVEIEFLDSDGDGIPDAQELLDGTNPNSVDTDGDGLVDGAGGIVTVASYPAGIDGNGDGFVDGELDYGTDPNGSNIGDLAPRGSPDNLVNVGDLLLMTQMVNGVIQPNVVETALGDIDGDGDLDIADLLLMQQSLLSGSAP
ncbi:MAG: M36 family metallopeptidase [Halioglobus sp.]|nr:M36 family metallopeptidase [Halioglobus sp.]